MKPTDILGLGVGPANLSLAALAAPVHDLRPTFLEAKPHFQWHSGIMLPEAQLQVSHVKDLVSLVDPTSRFSFLNYLVQTGRVFRALVANGISCSRQEFEQYYQWAADQLDTIHWKQRVESVRLADGRFEACTTTGERYSARTLVLGTGRTPVLPEFAVPLRGRQVLHGAEMLTVAPETRHKDVIVVGGGQSGAEIVNYLLSRDHELPGSLAWLSSRAGFLPMDDSPFTNEWFTPSYVEYFYGLPAERRAALLDQHRLASDGISESLLRDIYRRLYHLDLVAGAPVRHRLLAGRRMVDLGRDGDRLTVMLHDEDGDRLERLTADVVIFCTGYRSSLPDFLEPLRPRLLDEHGALRVRRDYSLTWDGPQDLRIYVQNAAETTHGIADPNLSLASWRSARIINSIAQREIYRLDHFSATATWEWACQDEQDPALVAPVSPTPS